MIPAVVLAAGASSRMGRPKATLPDHPGGGPTFLVRLLRTFGEAGVDDVVVVLGHDAAVVAASVAGAASGAVVAPRLVLNPAPEQGQFSSLLVGLRAVDRPGVDAMLVTLVDVPFVTAATVRAIIERYRQTGAAIVRPVASTGRPPRHGHPVLIDRTLFAAVRRADPSQGLKAVVRAHASAPGEVEVDDAGAFLDVDTPEEYERLRTGAGPRQP